MTRLLALIAFAFGVAAFYTTGSIMAVRLWRVVRSGALEQAEAWRAGAWAGALVVSLVVVPAFPVMVPAAYLLCYRHLARPGRDDQAAHGSAPA